MRLVLPTGLLPIVSLFLLVGCYKNIPAVSPAPVCQIGRIVRMINQDNSPSSSTYGKTSGRLAIDGKSVTVYITNSREYSYNPSGNLAHERISYTQSFQDTYFTYTSGKLASKSVSSSASGIITQVYSETVPLNDQGYDARSIYDAEGVLIPRGYVSEKRVDSNPLQQVIDDDGRIVKLNYTYDLTRFSLPNPRQFESRRSKNLLLTASSSGFHCCPSSHSEYRYQFDSKGRVSRQIILNWKGEFPDGSPFETVYVTDYEYECI